MKIGICTRIKNEKRLKIQFMWIFRGVPGGDHPNKYSLLSINITNGDYPLLFFFLFSHFWFFFNNKFSLFFSIFYDYHFIFAQKHRSHNINCSYFSLAIIIYMSNLLCSLTILFVFHIFVSILCWLSSVNLQVTPRVSWFAYILN